MKRIIIILLLVLFLITSCGETKYEVLTCTMEYGKCFTILRNIEIGTVISSTNCNLYAVAEGQEMIISTPFGYERIKNK